MSTTTQAEAREELRRKCEGYMTDSIGQAIAYLDGEQDGDDPADLIEAAGLGGRSAGSILRELTGVSI